MTVQRKLQFERQNLPYLAIQVPQSAFPLIHTCIFLDVHVRKIRTQKHYNNQQKLQYLDPKKHEIFYLITLDAE